jgi:outer membrane lipoprotein-sorting protein
MNMTSKDKLDTGKVLSSFKMEYVNANRQVVMYDMKVIWAFKNVNRAFNQEATEALSSLNLATEAFEETYST